MTRGPRRARAPPPSRSSGSPRNRIYPAPVRRVPCCPDRGSSTSRRRRRRRCSDRRHHRHGSSTSRRPCETRSRSRSQGQPLAAVVRDARVTIVVEPLRSPFPAHRTIRDRRHSRRCSKSSDLLGIPDESVTLLVAGGLAATGRPSRAPPASSPRPAAFHGRVLVHDAAAPDLVPALEDETRVNPAVVDADLDLVVSSAESGRPRRAGRAARRVRRRDRSPRRHRALARPGIGRARPGARSRRGGGRRAHAGLLGVSLVLDHPRLAGRFRGYPHEPASLEHVDLAVSPPLLAAAGRRATGILRDQTGRSRRPPPSRACRPSRTWRRSFERSAPRHTARPSRSTPSSSACRGRPAPAARAAEPDHVRRIALGHALRQWRDAFPVRQGGTLVLVHSLTRPSHGTQAPYRRSSTSSAAVARSRTPRRGAATRALDAYRAGRACHPLLPFADWAGCQPALSQLGASSSPAAATRCRTGARIRAEPLDLERARHGAWRRGRGARRDRRAPILLAPPDRAADRRAP